MGDHTLNSHDLSDGLRIDIRRRNFMLIHYLGLKGLTTDEGDALQLADQLYLSSFVWVFVEVHKNAKKERG